MSDAFEVLSSMDGPRPLPADLRARLEEQLLGSAARPLGADLDALLTERMTDPVAVLLEGLDAPLGLAAGQRGRLSETFGRRRRRPWLAGAAAAAVVLACAGLLATRDHPSAPTASQAAASHVPSATPQPPGAVADAAGTGTEGGGTTGGGLGAAPMPAPTPTGGQRAAVQDYAAITGLQVSPRHGPARGGTTVRLSGPGLATTAQVRFGDRAADRLVVHADGTVTVRSPAGTPGSVVDVTAVLSDGRRVVATHAFRYA